MLQEIENAPWMIIDTGFGRFLGKFKGVRSDETLTDKPEVVLNECVRLETVNVPIPAKGGVGVGTIGVQTQPVPWRQPFDRETDLCIPLDQVKWYVRVSEDDVTAMRKELMSRGPSRPSDG
jgi:hypothetical protein